MKEDAMGLSETPTLFIICLCFAVGQSDTNWRVTYHSDRICAIKGSTVVMHCDYEHPHSVGTVTIRVEETFWFTGSDDNPVSVEAQEEYAGRVLYSCTGKRCTLTIKDVKESDSAVYKFRFITNKPDGRYTGKPGVRLIVKGLKVSIQKYNSQSELECSSVCAIPGHSTYVWYRNGQKIRGRTSKNYLGYVDYFDSMSCAVEGHEDSPSPSTCVRDKSCYKVTYSSGRICAFKGSSVNISSSYHSTYNVKSKFWFSPDRSEEWRHASQPEDLSNDPHYAGRVDVTDTQGQSILTINDLKNTDSAEYRFKFQRNSFTWGADLHGTTLTVTALQVEVTRASVSQNTTYAELKCHSSCTPAASHGYIWFRNGHRVNRGKYTYKGSIYPADKISCAFSNYEEHRAQEVYAPVSPSVSAEPSGDIFEGNHVTLKCSSEANPPANNTLYKKTKSSTLQSLSGGSQFVLRSIQLSDSGEYCCVARNQLGDSQSSFFTVDVKYAPKRAEVSLSPTDVVEGISLSLTCRGDGNPAPFYSWYRDNQTMLQGQGGVYQFSSVRSEDSGTYHCKAENEYGPVNSTSVHINVEYSPRLPSVSVDPPGEVAVGSSVNLTCSSVANPAATYTWYKEDMTSPAADGHIFTIVDIRREHAGNYYCQARNGRGHINSIPLLIVVSSSPTAAVAGSITFLLLIALFLSTFIIFRRKMASRQTPETRERPGDGTKNSSQDLGCQLETLSIATVGNSTDKDDLHYASVQFSKKQEEPVYSNFMPAKPKTHQNEEEVDVEYSTVMMNTPCLRCPGGSEDSDVLYSTVNKL